jgi:hypoxanthine phosphoribosyltransferase
MIQILDLSFEKYISHDDIQDSISTLGSRINADYNGRELTVLSVLNGAYMFTSDLLKHLNVPVRLIFIKVKSYDGTASTGSVKWELPLNESLEGRDVLVVEDIIDTGLTMQFLLDFLKNQGANSVKTCALLYKREAFKGKFDVDFYGIDIPNEFIVGYGLDYREYGRNLKDIYKITT